MSLFAYAGKLRLAANKLMCRLVRMACESGVCCGDKWHASGSEGTQSSCEEGQIYLEWGPNGNNCCGCVPEQVFDPRVGDMVDTIDVEDDLCCPLVTDGNPLPFDLVTAEYIGCMGRCCRDGVCTNELEIECVNTGGVWYPGECITCGCPADCCAEDAAGNVTCETIECRTRCVAPRTLADPDCATGCLGQCCIDGEPQGMMTQAACDDMDGLWQGLGVEECSECPCREPYDCSCCESITSTAAGLTFFQPRKKRQPQFTDTFRVTVTGRTDSSIYVHGIPVGASCEFEVTFLLCGESFNIEPAECGTNFKKLDVKVCWEEEHTSGETLEIRGCEAGTIAAGSCRPDGCDNDGECTDGSDCTTTLLHDEAGAETDADIVVSGRMTIDSSGTGPLVLTGNITIPADACSLTLTLTGTNDDLNQIAGDILQQGANQVIVEKRGPGTWGLAGANTHTGPLRVLEGTLVVLDDVNGLYGTAGSPFGLTTTTSGYPQIGSPTATSGTVSLLLANDVSVARAFTVVAGSTQTVVIGGYGGGVCSIASAVTVTLARSVTLVAVAGATVTFANTWSTDSVTPTFTIGSEDHSGTVVLDKYLPGDLNDYGGMTAAVNVVNGTLRLSSLADDTIDRATPVTIGSSLGETTLDLNSRSQTLDSLSFAGSDGTVTSGTLRPVEVDVDGTGHAIGSAVSLSEDAAFTIEDDSDLSVSGVISGAYAITLGGDGLLTLSAANTYSGGTTINGGTARAGDVAAFGTGDITVNAGGTLDKNGFTLANTITNNGGTVLN